MHLNNKLPEDKLIVMTTREAHHHLKHNRLADVGNRIDQISERSDDGDVGMSDEGGE